MNFQASSTVENIVYVKHNLFALLREMRDHGSRRNKFLTRLLYRYFDIFPAFNIKAPTSVFCIQCTFSYLYIYCLCDYFLALFYLLGKSKIQ